MATPRMWATGDLIGTRNNVNRGFTLPLTEGAALYCIIFNGRKLHRTTISPSGQQYTITGNAVVLGLAPGPEDSLWAYTVVEVEEIPFEATVLLQQQRRTFYYNIEAYDKAGVKQEIIETDISATDWSYYAIGGCGEATIVLRRPYDDFGQLALDWGMEIWRERDLLGQAGARLPAELPIQLGTAHVGNRELRWSGFVREIERVLGDDEQVILKCAGWSRQLAYIFVPEQDTPWENMDVAAIVRDIIDRFVLPGSQIKRTPSANLVPDTGVIVNSINFDNTAWDAIRVLAEIAGNAEFGCLPSKEFYFLQPTIQTRQTHVIGDRIMLYRPRVNTDEVVNRVHVRGANGFKATINFSPEAGYHKERRELVSAIQTTEVATLWAAAYAARFAMSEPSGQLQLGMTDDWIEGAGHPLGLLRVIGSPIFVSQGDPLASSASSAAFQGDAFQTDAFQASDTPAAGSQLPIKLAHIYGKYTDERFRVASVRYVPSGDALNVDIGLGARKRPLADLMETINYKLSELQQGLSL